MKRLWICVLLLAGLTACAAPSGPGTWRCGESGDTGKLCVKLTAEEPITLGEPVTVTITVTSEKDVPGLTVFLSSYPKALIEGSEGWKEHGINWPMDAKANQSLSFTRRVRFPAEGEFQLTAALSRPDLHVDDSIRIYFAPDGGKVYYSGTRVPIPGWTPGQPAPAITLPGYTVTPGPSPTFIPTDTPWPTPTSLPVQRTPTPTWNPYPVLPPPSPLPTPGQ